MEQKTPPRRIIKINRGKQKSPVGSSTPEKLQVTVHTENPSNIQPKELPKEESSDHGVQKETSVSVDLPKEKPEDSEEGKAVDDLFKHFLARKMEIIELERSIRENDSAIAQKMNQEKEIAMRKKLEERQLIKDSAEQCKDGADIEPNSEKKSKKHKHKKHKKGKRSKKKKHKEKDRDKSEKKDDVDSSSDSDVELDKDDNKSRQMPETVPNSKSQSIKKIDQKTVSYDSDILLSNTNNDAERPNVAQACPGTPKRGNDEGNEESASTRNVIAKGKESEKSCTNRNKELLEPPKSSDHIQEAERGTRNHCHEQKLSRTSSDTVLSDDRHRVHASSHKDESARNSRGDERRSKHRRSSDRDKHSSPRANAFLSESRQSRDCETEKRDSRHQSKSSHYHGHENEYERNALRSRDSRNTSTDKQKSQVASDKKPSSSRRTADRKFSGQDKEDSHRESQVRSSNRTSSEKTLSKSAKEFFDEELEAEALSAAENKDEDLENVPSWDDRQRDKDLEVIPSWSDRQRIKDKSMKARKKEKEPGKTEEEIDEEYSVRLLGEIKQAYEKKGISGPLPDKLDLRSDPKPTQDIERVEEMTSQKAITMIEPSVNETPVDSDLSSKGKDEPNKKVAKEDDCDGEDNERPFRVMPLKRKFDDSEDDIVDFTDRKFKKKALKDTEIKSTENVAIVDNRQKTPAQSEDCNEEGDNNIKKQAPLVKLGLKISDTSAALISSGVQVENDVKRRNREEGEITDSSGEGESSSTEEEKEGDDLENVDEPDSSGQISDSESSKGSKKKKKKKRKERKHKKKKKKKHNKDKKRSRSPKRHRHHGSRSRSPSPRRRSAEFDKKLGVWSSRSQSPRGHRRSRSRSPGSWRRRSRDRSPNHSGHPERYDRYERSYRGRRGPPVRRSRSRERQRPDGEDLRFKIDKTKLREIAFKNAYANLHSGRGPNLDLKPEELAALKSGGKSIDELTDFCKKIAERQLGLSSDSDSDGMGGGHPGSDEEDAPFINHPFKVKPPEPIMMNIRNAKQLPILSASEKQAKGAELRLQFPVSSGTHHKGKESEWVPVEKKSSAPATGTNTTTTVAIPGSSKVESTAAETMTTTTAATTAPTEQPTAVNPPGALWALSLPPPPPPPSSAGDVAQALAALGKLNAAAPPSTPDTSAMPPPPPPPPLLPPPPPAPEKEVDKVFPDPPKQPINIGAIVSDRLSAMRKLQDNPNDVQALGTMFRSQQDMNKWAASKLLPGQFTGTTGLTPMTQQELIGVNPKHQAWIKKDTFSKAAPVSGGIGKMLLQRMGWNEGEGLGQHKQGSLEPLMLDVKVDRKGLTSQGESTRKGGSVPVVKDLSGKHPVSALVELCNRRRWGAPDFQMVHESGPDHKKNFLFKVCINGMEYQASVASNNKKHAKAQAASVCLQELGLIPKGPV